MKLRLGEGDSVLLIGEREGTTHLSPATVMSLSPFVVRVMIGLGDGDEPVEGAPVTVVATQSAVAVRGDGLIAVIDRRHSAFFLELEMRRWRGVDRRRDRRLPTRLPVEIVSVDQAHEHPEYARFVGESRDISLTGLSVVSGGPVQEGWLVHVRATLPTGGELSELAEIARVFVDSDGARVAALDFVDTLRPARKPLEAFLRQLSGPSRRL